jgi:hypothetical protein
MRVRNSAVALALLIGVVSSTAACTSTSKSQSPPRTAEPGRHPGLIRPGPPTTIAGSSATTASGAGGM